ncbi:uncharacterized protein BX663DRAFT_512802 [Cokeromyces recurvatus]|uniref:uncharacterized protein n=1 Tax=Cokeromyces recurvatus TaxID=90255 RepID=UPI00221E9FFB|nr:uncharacterized protein BX663DRAFT_512802 [Cokeromyces recurvatus]KAI7901912.1 hypothetical protein BX663DRAFT_512802 [Cokeromyces recurvatus]
MSSSNVCIDSDFHLLHSIPQSNSSSTSAINTSTSLSQEPWNKVQSSYAAKRKQIQAERKRQLKELEEQVAETANWAQRRKELVTTTTTATTRRPLFLEEEVLYPNSTSTSSTPSSSSSTTIARSRQSSSNTINKLDLGDATLEELEGLIAASAKRLASYRLRNQKNENRSQNTIRSSVSLVSTPSKKWKELLEHNSLNNPSSTIHQVTKNDSSELLDDQSFTTTTTTTTTTTPSSSETDDKQPSASYLRLRNIFERSSYIKKSESSTLLSSKNSTLANLSPSISLNQSTNTSTKAKQSDNSSIFNSTATTEEARMSQSTASRLNPSTHLKKTTRSFNNQQQEATPLSSLVSSSSSSFIDYTKKDNSTTMIRSRKRSELASMQQQYKSVKQGVEHEEVKKESDVKIVNEYMTSIKKPSTKLHQTNHLSDKRKVKLSITTANISSSTGSSKNTQVRRTKEVVTAATTAATVAASTSINSSLEATTPVSSSTVATVVRRKRGKPSIAPIALPPMKVEPLNIPSVQKTARNLAKTPTRIPLPTTTNIPTSTIPKQKLALAAKRTNNTILSENHTNADNDGHHQKPKGLAMNTRVKPKYQRQLRKPKSTSAVSTTPKLQASKSNKSTDDNTLRKVSTTIITPTSSTVTTNNINKSTRNGLMTSLSSKTISDSVSKRKVSTLHERLQNLVDESKSWTAQMERDKIINKPTIEMHNTSEIILRGRGMSTSLNSNHPTESPTEDTVVKKLLINHPRVTMRVAMTPEAALKLYQFNLTSYEKQEMMNYENIYFVGHHAKKRPTSPSQTICNYGYDDERGDYLVQIRDHLDYRYEVLELMGKGSFGQVLKCFDHRTSQTVAVKIIRNKKRFHTQALVEVKILENLITWDAEDKHNNVRMLGHFVFRNHLCIAFECLSINLYEFIKSNGFQGFSMGLIRRFAMQLLNSLTLLQKHKLIHCDLKPENILLKHPTKSTIKVIDFGSSCLESEKVYTYIQSRFYRSPEVIMGMNYSMAIDMWSLGCILAELHTGYPLFPGENEQEQLACIMEIQNVPEPYIIEKSSRRKLFFDSQGNPRIQPNSKGRKRRPGTKTLEHALKTTDETFVDFINKCLCWDPEQRMKPDEALKHPWMMKSSSRKHGSR